LQPLTQEEELTLPEAAPDAAPVAPGGPAVLVDRFVVTGAEAIPTATLEALLTDLQGKALTLAELQEAAARVTRHYRDQGYFLTRAYPPRQHVSEGVSTICVLEGRLGKVDINNQSRVRDAIVKRPLKHLQPGQMLQADDFETPLLRLNDIVG